MVPAVLGGAPEFPVDYCLNCACRGAGVHMAEETLKAHERIPVCESEFTLNFQVQLHSVSYV